MFNEFTTFPYPTTQEWQGTMVSNWKSVCVCVSLHIRQVHSNVWVYSVIVGLKISVVGLKIDKNSVVGLKKIKEGSKE